MVIYTSGTTGRPKGTVHVHGGFPIKAAQDLAHTFDLRTGDALCWVTDLGWMMGPWAISGALLLGARLVHVRGRTRLAGPGPAVGARRASPDHPSRGQPDPGPGAPGPRRGAREGPRSLVAPGHRLDRRALEPGPVAVGVRRRRRWPPADRQLLRRDGDRRRDRRVLAPPADPADLVQRAVRRDGGGHRGLGRPAGPRRGRRARDPGALAGDDPRVLGRARTTSATSRPTGGAVPELWIHGDWAATDADGYWYIHGRSDDTLKVAGKRVGPAEVEACAVAHPAVVAAAAIGVPDELKGEAIVVLVRPAARAWPGTS